jgi:hypothetical protein
LAIDNIVEWGALVHAYDAGGRPLTTIYTGHGPQDGLVDYTSSTINVRRGRFLISYNEKGQIISSVSER